MEGADLDPVERLQVAGAGGEQGLLPGVLVAKHEEAFVSQVRINPQHQRLSERGGAGQEARAKKPKPATRCALRNVRQGFCSFPDFALQAKAGLHVDVTRTSNKDP
jgi:hypothetical protein